MPCPRCDGPLLELSLGENAASVCDRCGHVGLSTDLHAVTESEESWEESLERFRERVVG